LLKILKGLAKTRIVTEGPGNWGETQGKGLPVINCAACPEGCVMCLEACPAGAISQKTVNPRLCIYCHTCRRVCPAGAIAETDIPLIMGTTRSEEAGSALRQRIKKICTEVDYVRTFKMGTDKA